MTNQESGAINPIIATNGSCGHCHSVRTVRVYHRDFPEAWAEGQSPEVAASGLIDRLSRALETTPDPWRSVPIRVAIAEARAFINRGDKCGDKWACPPGGAHS